MVLLSFLLFIRQNKFESKQQLSDFFEGKS